MLDTPVLFIVFNRPDTTAKVFERIRAAQPKRLYLAADGPRPHVPEDAEKCKQVRAIVSKVDWDCEVKTLFNEENLGCGVAPAGAITWLFENEEKGIILEDDCLPDLSFFTFCQELLNYYDNDEFVMHIGGTNSQAGKKRGHASYYFSKYPHIWGWATWRRAWSKFQFQFSALEELKLEYIFNEYQFNELERNYWINHWNIIKDGNRKDIWDMQWTFSCWMNRGITIVPNKNLISNLGFNKDATHTVLENSKLANLKTYKIERIIHPKEIKINEEADLFTFKNYNLMLPSVKTRLRNKLSSLLPASIKKLLKNS